VDNLSQKINVKLGGINSIVNTKLALTRSSKEDVFMFFGADVKMKNIRLRTCSIFLFRLHIQLHQLIDHQ